MLCHECGTAGHIARDCPHKAQLAVDKRPMWCGTCDQRTRLLDLGGGWARRCQCHPLSHLPLAQHRRCQGCHATTYIWDLMPCGQHQQVARRRPYHPTSQEPRWCRDDRAVAMEQVNESRAERGQSPAFITGAFILPDDVNSLALPDQTTEGR